MTGREKQKTRHILNKLFNHCDTKHLNDYDLIALKEVMKLVEQD